jgi:hypothetical protein
MYRLNESGTLQAQGFFLLKKEYTAFHLGLARMIEDDSLLLDSALALQCYNKTISDGRYGQNRSTQPERFGSTSS